MPDAPAPEFARPFNLTTAEGVDYHGVEFPAGFTVLVLADPAEGPGWVAVSMDDLLSGAEMQGATIEWPKGAAGV